VANIRTTFPSSSICLIRGILFFLLPVSCFRIGESDGRTSASAGLRLERTASRSAIQGGTPGRPRSTARVSGWSEAPGACDHEEHPMSGSGRFRVVIADFLDETSVESPVLKEIADLVLCGATREEELAEALPGADAIILFHDIPQLGEASFARASRCQCVV